MKLVTIILVGTILLQGVSCKPFFFDLIGNIASGIGNATQIASNIGQQIIGSGASIANGAIQTGAGIAQGLVGTGSNIVSGIANGVQSVSSVVQQQFQNAISRLQNIINSAQGFGSNLFKNAAEQVKNRLTAIKTSVENAVNATNAKLDTGVSKLANVSEEAQNELNTWAETQREKLTNASQENQDEGNQIINDFVNNSTEKINNCTLEILLSLQSLYNETVNIADSQLPVVDEAVQKVDNCTRNNPYNIIQVISCVQSVANSIPSLSQVRASLLSLQTQSAAFNPDNVAGTGTCMPTVLAEIQAQESDVEQQIDALAS